MTKYRWHNQNKQTNLWNQQHWWKTYPNSKKRTRNYTHTRTHTQTHAQTHTHAHGQWLKPQIPDVWNNINSNSNCSVIAITGNTSNFTFSFIPQKKRKEHKRKETKAMQSNSARQSKGTYQESWFTRKSKGQMTCWKASQGKGKAKRARATRAHSVEERQSQLNH